MPEVASEDRCRGHCCRCFVLSVDYADLQKSVENIEGAAKFHDDVQILDMLIPLGELSAVETLQRFGISPAEGEPSWVLKPRFSCRHLLPNGDCGIYDSRPHMCQTYPKSKCQYRECQSTCFKRGDHVAKDLGVVATTLEDVSLQTGNCDPGGSPPNQGDCH